MYIIGDVSIRTNEYQDAMTEWDRKIRNEGSLDLCEVILLAGTVYKLTMTNSKSITSARTTQNSHAY